MSERSTVLEKNGNCPPFYRRFSPAMLPARETAPTNSQQNFARPSVKRSEAAPPTTARPQFDQEPINFCPKWPAGSCRPAGTDKSHRRFRVKAGHNSDKSIRAFEFRPMQILKQGLDWLRPRKTEPVRARVWKTNACRNSGPAQVL